MRKQRGSIGEMTRLNQGDTSQEPNTPYPEPLLTSSQCVKSPGPPTPWQLKLGDSVHATGREQVHPNDFCHLEVAYDIPVRDEASDPAGLRLCPLALPLEPLSPEALAQVGWGPTGDNDRFRK